MTRRVGRWIDRVEDVCVGVSALALASIMLITVLGVVMRYLFGSPLGWSFGFIEDYLLVTFFFLAVSYTFRVGGHISLDVFVRRLSDRSRRVLGVVGNALSFLFFALIVYAGIIHTWGAWINHEIPPPGGVELSWPTWTSYVFVPLGMAVLVVRLLHTIARREERASDEYVETEI